MFNFKLGILAYTSNSNGEVVDMYKKWNTSNVLHGLRVIA